MRRRLKGVVAFAVAALIAMGVSVPTAYAEYAGVKPENGTTQGQPFAPGTGGSANFRIPGIVTLDDGTIVAATDARWNHAGDGAGLDTIVSVSKDGGANWTYTFANYLGDNGNTYNNQSTSFIDPAIATDGETIYLVADLFPAGIALNTSISSPVAGKTGFTEDGSGLLLRVNGHEEINSSYGATVAAKAYDYYLDLVSMTIHESDGTLVEGYEVDPWFNITDSEGNETNLFCADAPFQVYPTDYLYLTTSTDGLTWSEPTLINAKKAEEQTLLAGPGNGVVLDDGTIVFSVYEYTSGKQEAGIIWSTDRGETWHRSAPVTSHSGGHWSSEATAVQIDDTTIRQFYRDGFATLYYTDYTKQTDGTWVPGEAVNTGLTKRSNNQLSAIKYSEQVDGRDVIIVSTASNPGDRRGGKLYVGFVNNDAEHTMDWQYGYAVNGFDDYYAYSCLTELEDGSIGLLYEKAGSTETFVVIPFDELVSDKANLAYEQRSVELDEGASVTINDPSGDYSDADTSSLNAEVATVVVEDGALNETAAKVGSAAGTYEGAAVSLADCLFTFTAEGDNYIVSGTDANGNTVYLDPAQGSAGYPVKTTNTHQITVSAGAEADSVYLRDTAGSYLFFYKNSLQFDRVNALSQESWKSYCSALLYRPAAEGETSSAEIPGYVKVTDFTNLAGGEYLIAFLADNGNYYLLYPSASTAHKSAQGAQVIPGGPSTDITFTGVAPGNTGVLIGNTYYDVTVNKVYDFVTTDAVDVTASSEVSSPTATEGGAAFANDGNESTYWHSKYPADLPIDQIWIELALDEPATVNSFHYLPRQSGENGTVTAGVVECSADGESWETVTEVSWPDYTDKSWRVVEFAPVAAQYFRLRAVHTYAAGENDKFMSAAEVRVAKTDEVVPVPETHTATFDANGGTVDVASIEVTQGEAYGELPVPVREGYEFLGWFLGEDEVTSETVFDGDSDVTLVASWEPLSFSMDFDVNGGEVDVPSFEVAYGEPFGELPTPEREGYTFDGWFLGEEKITPDTIFMGTAGATLEARWTANTYTVTLNAGEGTVDPATLEVTYGEAFGELPVPVREGFEFLGWFLGEDEVTPETVFETASDVTLLAQWKQNEPVNPDQPGAEDPDQPGTEDPDQPGTTDPGQKPGSDTKPGTGSDVKPGTGASKPSGTQTVPETGDPLSPTSVVAYVVVGGAVLVGAAIVLRRMKA